MGKTLVVPILAKRFRLTMAGWSMLKRWKIFWLAGVNYFDVSQINEWVKYTVRSYQVSKITTKSATSNSFEFQKFSRISKIQSNFKNSVEFQKFIQISKYQLNSEFEFEIRIRIWIRIKNLNLNMFMTKYDQIWLLNLWFWIWFNYFCPNSTKKNGEKKM